MKIKISRDELLNGVQRVQGVVEKRTTMPILGHILVQGTEMDNRISMYATDLEIGIQEGYSATVMEPGSMTLSGKKLYEIARELPQGEITISTSENHWVLIESGKSTFRMAGMPPEEFPAPPAVSAELADARIQIDAAVLGRLIRQTYFAAGENDARYVLNGLLLEVQDGLGGHPMVRLVATDGNRLAISEQKIAHDSLNVQQGTFSDLRVILPKKSVLEIKKVLDEKKQKSGESPVLLVLKNQLVFQWGTLVLTSRLIDGTYPNYRHVLPTHNDKKIPVRKADLLSAIRRVSLLAHDKMSAVRFDIQPGQVVLTSNDPAVGEAREEVVSGFSGEPFSVGFNANFMADVLGVLEKEEVIFEYNEPLQPYFIREEGIGFSAILMPMRQS